MTVYERIKYLREKSNMSQSELAEKVGYKSKAAISKVEKGLRDISQTMLVRYAIALGTTPAYLMGWEDDPVAELPGALNVRPIGRKSLPMLGNVACGEPIFADETRDAFVSVENDLDADFCLTAQGDSMVNARIFDGDVLFVKRQEIVNDGEIAVVLIGDEATVKRVYYDKENNVITLVPENPTYKPMRFMGADLDRIRIIGKVVMGQYLM